MTICKVCGVELDDGMNVCPLCGTPVGTGSRPVPAPKGEITKGGAGKSHLLQQVLWQITSVLLFSCIVATLTINLSIRGAVTWSIYPVSICLVIFSYASLMAFWHTRLVFQIIAAWAISSVILLITSAYVGAEWPVNLALPLLSAINIVGLAARYLLMLFKVKGLNVLTVAFVSTAILCVAVEAIISLYLRQSIRLQWSVIVAACLLPVTAALLFMYFRTRNNADLQKLFHN